MKETLQELTDYASTTENTWLHASLLLLKAEIEKEIMLAEMVILKEQL
jgi:hypothetical protein